MWWSRESRERRKEALAQRPHIKEALAEAAPISQEIDDLLRSKGISVWTAIVALAASLGTAAAVATSAGPLKGYLRVAHHYVDSAFCTIIGAWATLADRSVGGGLGCRPIEPVDEPPF
jgi:hypothetical protein